MRGQAAVGRRVYIKRDETAAVEAVQSAAQCTPYSVHISMQSRLRTLLGRESYSRGRECRWGRRSRDVGADGAARLRRHAAAVGAGREGPGDGRAKEKEEKGKARKRPCASTSTPPFY